MGLFYRFVDHAEDLRTSNAEFPIASMSAFPQKFLNPNNSYQAEIGVRFAEGARQPYLFSATLKDKTTCKPITAEEIKRFAQFIKGTQGASITAFRGRKENVVLKAEAGYCLDVRSLNGFYLSRKNATHLDMPLYQRIAKSLGLNAQVLEEGSEGSMTLDKLAEICADTFGQIISVGGGICAKIVIGSIDPLRSVELTSTTLFPSMPVQAPPENKIKITIGSKSEKRPPRGFEYGALEDAESLIKSYRP